MQTMYIIIVLLFSVNAMTSDEARVNAPKASSYLLEHSCKRSLTADQKFDHKNDMGLVS